MFRVKQRMVKGEGICHFVDLVESSIFEQVFKYVSRTVLPSFNHIIITILLYYNQRQIMRQSSRHPRMSCKHYNEKRSSRNLFVECNCLRRNIHTYILHTYKFGSRLSLTRFISGEFFRLPKGS